MQEEVEVRLLGPDELAILEQVDPDVFDNPVRLDLAAQYLANPNNLLAVAIQAGEVVGMASAITYVHPDKPLSMFINEVGVSEKLQGQGLGKRLMSALLQQGHTLGCTEAWVATDESNGAARAFYTSVAGEEDPERAVIYTWLLSEPDDEADTGDGRMTRGLAL